jgi:hypothetical protein
MVIRKQALRLILLVAGAYLACGVILGLATLLAGRADWWRPMAAAAAIAAMAAIMSVSVLLIGLGRGPTAAISAVIAATAVRLLCTIVGCVTAVAVGGIAAAPLLLFSVAFYFTTLLSESAFALQIARGVSPATATLAS